MTQHKHLWIDGKRVEGSSGHIFKSFNPATGEEIATIDEATKPDIDRAVQAAQKAFEAEWGDLSPSERGSRLYALARLIKGRSDELAELDTLDCGKPITECKTIDIPASVSVVEFFAGLADKIRGAQIPSKGFLNYTVREPYGVVGAIIPWNYPLLNAVTKVAPALACGNTIVLKPAEQTPLSALELGLLAQEAGIPDGVINIVPGFGPSSGASLVKHPGVSKIAFTGSTEVGKQIMRMAADGVKSVTLELGGKAPNIIFNDADLEEAIAACLFSVFRNQGQTCTSGTRVLVHESIATDFVDRLVERAQKLKIGDPMDPTTKIGAIVSDEQFDRVVSYVESGINEGAKLVTGGERPPDPAMKKGFFMLPTVFENVSMQMKIAQEEIFGPVLSVLTFKDDEEAIRKANDVVYGLSAAIWTRDIRKAHRFATQLQAGLVWINTIHAVSPVSPYGGFKQSGLGVEYGIEAADDYTHIKSVWIGLEEGPIPWANA